MFFRLLFCCALLLLLSAPIVTRAQDFDIKNYEINVQLQPAANSAQVESKLALLNITTQGRSGPFVNLKINKRAKVTAVLVDGATAQFRQKNDERLPELSNLSIDFPAPVKPGATAQVAINYTLEFKESTPIGAISPGETVLLPESFWVPFVHTPFAITYGIDVAPIKLTATAGENERVQSDGVRRAGGAMIFEQVNPSQPLLLSGNYEDPIEIKAAPTTFEVVYARGLGPNARKQAEALVAESSQILAFYQKLLGFAPPANIRLVSSPKVSSYVAGNTVVFNEDLFRRDTLDVETLEFLARALLRSKIGGELVARGPGWTFIHDVLPAYLTGLYFEQRFGEVAGHEFFLRRARAYAPIVAAKNDGPLTKNTPLDNQYATSMYNKGPLMMRLIEQQLTRAKLTAILADFFNNSKNKQLRYDELRRALIAADKNLTTFIDQWLENIFEPDLIIGIPVAAEGGWKCALRNLGTGQIQQVTILATTAKGEQLSTRADVPSQGLGEAFFKTAEQLVSVEVDPDKLYPQTNYDNDTRPVASSPFTLFRDANASFIKKDFAGAEAKLREAVKREPTNSVTRTLLARTLAAQSKFDEAKSEVEAIQKLAPLPVYSITWTNYTLGEIALSRKSPDAVDYFRRALAAGKDIAPIRQRLIEVEKSSSQLPAVDETVRSFISTLDRALKEATVQTLEPVMLRANLSKFMRAVAANKPDSWTTEILRAERVSADTVAVDVSVVAVSSDKKEQRGTALFILHRGPSGWILNNVELFNVQ